MVKALTLRGISPELARRLESLSRRSGSSVNRTAIALLEESLGFHHVAKRVRHHDLDHLAGKWNKEMGEAFDRALKEQR